MEIQFLLIFILFIIVILHCISKTEYYDAKISNYDKINCAIKCKTTAGCAGFGWDQDLNNCYLSRSSIHGYPNGSKYRKDYKATQYRCNKMRTLNVPTKLTVDDRAGGSTYMCSDQVHGIYGTYVQTKNDLIPIYDYESISNRQDLDSYVDDYSLDDYL